MARKLNLLDTLTFSIIITLFIITLCGILSFSTNNTSNIINQYGDTIEMFGNGVYKNDSSFKASIFIGSDLFMLIFMIPTLIYAHLSNKKYNTIKTKLFLTSILGIILYYSASIVFGVKYNFLFIIYIILFFSSSFSLFINIRNLSAKKFTQDIFNSLLTKGLKIFLILCSLALFIAWLPDVISSLISGKSLDLIEVYTTEITYVLDMALISPLFVSIIYLLKRKDSLGIILMAVLLTLCVGIGIMLPLQTVFQTLMGIHTPIEVFVTKIGIFIILSIFSLYFLRKLYKNLST